MRQGSCCSHPDRAAAWEGKSRFLQVPAASELEASSHLFLLRGNQQDSSNVGLAAMNWALGILFYP